jgi:penicillin-binding protein 1C
MRFLLLLVVLLNQPVWATADFATVKRQWQSSEGWLLARDGRPIQQLRLDTSARRLNWVPLSQVSPAMQQLLLASEDQRFYEHQGVDWQAFGAASWQNLQRTFRLGGGQTANANLRGASTLSMQLAGLLDDGGVRQGRRNLLQKLGQMQAAYALERQWQKAEIIEAYLNLVSFRGELQGIAAMSEALFKKQPLGLDERESALAVALLRAPEAKASHVARRACSLLTRQQRAESCTGLPELASRVLRPPYRVRNSGVAPHFARHLLDKDKAGQQVRSTLDADLQTFAQQSLQQQLLSLSRRNVADGAVLVLDNASGEVRAWVGSSGVLSEAAQVDGVMALRQAGSTLKPFLYGLAIENHEIDPASVLEDSPVRIASPLGLYVPQNYDRQFKGLVSVRLALGSSLNVPAVRTLLRVGPDRFHQRLLALGLSSLTENGDYYGYSLALGGADVSLLALTNAYRVLANGGQYSSVRYQPDAAAPDSKVVIPAPVAAIVADMLADRSARVLTFGLDSILSTRYWSAAKTGTSKDMRDNWCIGFSPRYTVGVWVGNASGAPMHEVSGVTGAAPIWREVMGWLHLRGQPLLPAPALPSGVVARQIHYEPPLEPPRRELFLSGHERDTIRLTDSASARWQDKTTPAPAGKSGKLDKNRLRHAQNGDEALARIAYPGQGTVLALDLDIPASRQRVFFEATGPGDWRLNGRMLSAAELRTGWLPQPGRHQLQLIDALGNVLDSARFEVRTLAVSRR